ncbi:class I histocompatibility antigen, Gogo-OKO alpha chain-like [Pelmatolapia mariae]|uniref:class I histocompatibility antigen, Gogo-OKO alpha chain-like n=1 Tax=Pelmatolapia mariae TaxID=158779 RepID=UPI003211D7EC
MYEMLMIVPKASSSPVSCHVTGFYPNRGLMFWRKDGEDIHEGADPGEILPNIDGTFLISVDLKVSSVKSEDWRRYECVFQFSDGEDSIVTKLDKPVIRTNRGKNRTIETLPDMMIPVIAIVVAAVVVLILVAAVGFAVYKKKKGGQDAGAYSMSHNATRGSTEQTSLSQS